MPSFKNLLLSFFFLTLAVAGRAQDQAWVEKTLAAMSLEEKVGQLFVADLVAPPAVVGWLQAFVDQHHQVEPKRRKRPESFRPLTDRFGQPVRISTDKLSRGRGGA